MPIPPQVQLKSPASVSLPVGKKPFRSVVDFTQSDVEHDIAVTEKSRGDFVSRMGSASCSKRRRE
jgi:hypothetical protein